MSDALLAVRSKFDSAIENHLLNMVERVRRWCAVYDVEKEAADRYVERAERYVARVRSDVAFALAEAEKVQRDGDRHEDRSESVSIVRERLLAKDREAVLNGMKYGLQAGNWTPEQLLADPRNTPAGERREMALEAVRWFETWEANDVRIRQQRRQVVPLAHGGTI